MGLEGYGGERQQEKFLLRRCPTCGVKLHIDAFYCWKCGKRYNYDANSGKFVEDIIYGSENQNDYIYSLKINCVEMCMSCRNTQAGKTCKYALCFGSGKGECGSCADFMSTRFDCCQRKQKSDAESYNRIKRIYEQSVQPLERQKAKTA